MNELNESTADDLDGIRADDALLDALGGRDTEQADALADDALNGLLLDWRRKVDRRPVGPLVTTGQAVKVIRSAKPVSRRTWALRAVCAVLVVVTLALNVLHLVASWSW